METLRSHLNPTTLKIFRLLWSGVRLSRNQHFDLYRDPKAAYARRLHRLFLSLSADLDLHGKRATIYTTMGEPHLGGRLGVQIEIPLLRGRRTVFLTAEELDLFAACAPNHIAELLATFTRAVGTEVAPCSPARASLDCG